MIFKFFFETRLIASSKKKHEVDVHAAVDDIIQICSKKRLCTCKREHSDAVVGQRRIGFLIKL